MPELQFQLDKAEVEPFAIAPQLSFLLRISNNDPEELIHTVVLRAQVQIEAPRRAYSSTEQANLGDLFGAPERWGQTLRTFLWTHTSVIVPAFQGSTDTKLPVPCTFDFNVAATKYFAGLADGEVPVCVQFSGTVFYAAERRTLAGDADPVGQGSALPPAGETLERPDGHLLPRCGVAMPGARRL